MLKKILLSICFVSMSQVPGFAQQTDTLATGRAFTLGQVIQISLEQSPSYLLAQNQLNNRYWQYRTFKSNYRPQILLEGNLPDLTRAFRPVIQPDGSNAIREISTSTSSLSLSLSQNIGPTGGTIFVNSNVGRIDNFGLNREFNYFANPAVVGINQPIFAFNKLAWDKKIEPLRYEESKKQYAEELEGIAVDATERYFNLLLAQIRLEIATKNYANTDTLFKIAQGRYSLGKIAENELLQLELSLMRAGQEVTQAKLDVETTTLRLKMFMGLTDTETIQLIEPLEIPGFIVDSKIALEESRKNRQQIIAFKRQLLEADQQVAQAKGDNGFRANIFATYGLTQSARTVPDLYVSPNNQQQVNIGFSVPIIDWGRSQSRIKTAMANQELVRTNIKQQEVNFDQEIYLMVQQFNMSREQLSIAIKADEIANKRYEITKNRYLIGKIAITDLNIAQQEKDEAKRGYVSALRNYWGGYYLLRRLTLYDFSKNAPITYDFMN